jgi:hypothetical protein
MFRRLALPKVYSQSARLRVFLVSVLLLVLPLFIYFSLHISSRTKYFKDRNFRQLNNFGLQIGQRIDNLSIAFTNSVENFVRTQNGNSKNLRTDFQNYLNILKPDGTYFTATEVQKFSGPKQDSDLQLRVSIDVGHEDGKSWLYFDCVGKDKGDIHFKVKTDFDELIKPLISKTGDDAQGNTDIPDEFDHIIVARADNSKVLFESANDDLTLTSMDQISLADNSDKHLDLQIRGKTTDSVDITVAGARYKLYEQPIEIALRTKDTSASATLWVICGLVEASRFRYLTWAVSHTVLIVTAFFAGLLILSWPFLKLIFIGPKDRLRFAETLMLAVSVVIAGSLLTFFFLFGVSYLQLESQLNQQLIDLAKNFQDNFKQEVEAALRQIDNLDARRSGSLKDTQTKKSDAEKQLDNQIQTNHLNSICPGGVCDPRQNPYPYFKMISWVDNTGMQVSKWSINSQITRFLNVGGRDYFSKLRNGYYRELGDQKFWLERITSQNTGGVTVVISKEAPAANVVALDTNLMSLTTPAIVSGYGYRIIDVNGNVVFPNVKENFFAECGNDNRLRSAVTGHLSDSVSVSYLGRDSRVYVTPLQVLPDWTLVVFRDKEPLRSSFTEIVALSATLFLIYLVPLLLLLAILCIASLVFGKRMKWIWPYADAAPIYLQSIVVTVILIVIAWKISPAVSYTGVLVLSLLSVAAVAVMILLLRYKWALKPSVKVTEFLEKRWSRVNYRSLYSLCLVMLVLMIAVFPSLTFFRHVYDEELELFIKYGQVTLVHSLNEREERLRAAYPSSIFATKDAADTFLRDRFQKDLDRYYAFFFKTTIDDNGGKTNSGGQVTQPTILSKLRKSLPFSNPTSVVRHGLVENASADGLWSWDGSDTNLAVQAPHGSANGNAVFHITSNTEQFQLPRLFLWPFIGLMILVLFLLIRFILNRVFLLGTIETSPFDAKALKPTGMQKLFLVLGPQYTGREKLLPATDFEILNLRSGSEWHDQASLDKFLKDAGSKAIGIDYFEHQIDQPQNNLQKLDLLERLMTHQGALLVTSMADPTDYVFENADHTANENSDAGPRWASVMSSLWMEYREDSGDPGTFRTELAKKQEQSRHKGERKLYGLLIDECAPRACLEQIGREIAQRRDLKTSRPDDLISDVLMQAHTYYKLIWESCSPGEKLTLTHLAMDGFLSINDPDVPRLVRRGLIVRHREIRLMNESFSLFVLDKSRADKEVELAEGQARRTSSWQYLKVSLSVTVIGLMVFLFATQRDLYNSTLLALTSIAAGVPAVFNFFNLFRRQVGGGSSPAPPSS